METFHDLELNPLLHRALDEMGLQKPTPIQAQALPILLGEATDFMGLAATGTGKTLAFAIPLLERVEPSLKWVQCLVLSPTRELAIQTSGQIDLLGKHMGVRALPIYGGAPYGDQIHGLKRGLPVVVGTPGRVVDHMERGTLDLSGVHTIVLDEADEMISMGFKEDLEKILSKAPRKDGKNSAWLFAATMSPDVRRVADKFLKKPKHVQVNRTEIVPEAIEQIYYRTHEGDKPEILCKLVDAADDFFGVVFCQTKALVVDLTQYMRERGYAVDCLHGDMDQNARERTMRAFRARKVTILICTDVASRGIDVKDITHVINYSLPREFDNYIHRIGRTARSGKKGFAMSLVTPSHRGLIPRIEGLTKSRMREGVIPTRRDIGAKKVSAFLAKFQDQSTFARAVELMDPSWKSAIAGMTPEEIAGRFIALAFPDVFAERPSEAKSAATPVAARAPMAGRAPMAPARAPERAERGYSDRKRFNDRPREQRWGGSAPRFDRAKSKGASAASRVGRG